MNGKYLTSELKKYYLDDFNKLLEYNENDFWDIDTGILNALVKINSNSAIQTLFSKTHSLKEDTIGGDGLSYLKLAFDINLRAKLQELLSSLNNTYNSKESNYFFIEDKPIGNSNFRENSKIQIGCLNNPNYFNLVHFHINLYARNTDIHSKFWDQLANTLSVLKNP